MICAWPIALSVALLRERASTGVGSTANVLDAERGEVGAVCTVDLAANARGEEIRARRVAVGDKRSRVARKVEVEPAVGFYYLSLYLQKVLGYSAITAGVSQLPLAAGIVVAAGIASPLVARVGIRQVLLVGLTLFVGGLVWFAQLPVHGSYLVDILGPSLLIALGLGMAFVPITILSVTGVKDREYGLASGLVNTSQEIGGALGLAVLSTVATSRTNHLAAARHSITQALTLGFHTAFLGAGAFVLVAIIAAVTHSAAGGPSPTTRPQRRSLPNPPNPTRNKSPGAQPASGAHTVPGASWRCPRHGPARDRPPNGSYRIDSLLGLWEAIRGLDCSADVPV
jgi:MFS transporter